ncbi:DUF424 family protein [Desulfurococcaceae archaeon MEX13E-LK6-19]|nr:DUF424 family protein [Desulfurococcaceae archaeon MEX13E-LK6-19]
MVEKDVMVYVKEHWWGTDHVVAVCDMNLLGKVLDNRGVKFFVDPVFYGGELVSIEKAIELIRRSTIANLVGKNIVEAAINEGLVHPDAVIEINGVPHAQIIKVFE